MRLFLQNLCTQNRAILKLVLDARAREKKLNYSVA